ncbi:unnamed protein product [Leptidea sinapis]|uniref:Structural maintenance of chromosomes protein 5 n=1 Tax=Leptidea sinapis TaxID=189913 RepID=A0A5E4Q949_9NEOP|nr:unnamed protein product [Leptidea sinapis]
MKRKQINDNVERVKTISAQIRLQESKVHHIQNEPLVQIDVEKKKCEREQREVVVQQCAAQRELCHLMKELQKGIVDRELWTIRLDFSRIEIVSQEATLRELRNELNNVQAALENIENLLTRAKSNAKEKLLEAKRTCNNKLPQDPDFPYKDEFNDLPSDLRQLQELCIELQTRIDCMGANDDQIVKEFENRERLIAKLKVDVSSSSETNKNLVEKMNKIKSKWLPALEKLLNDINRSFGNMFSKLGCAGEIRLEKTGSDEDYDKYGVGIFVSFRGGEQLQQLTRHAQSGGERALCTALCVDEINQGMDAVNERKMFQLLVKVTTECDNSQYFLLTPKLLRHLQFGESVMIHTIMNGKQIMNYKQWNVVKHLENAHNYRP